MANLQKKPTKPKVCSSPKSHSPYILIVEDEPTHVAVLRHTIQSANPNTVVKVVGSLKEYRNAITKHLPDIVLIDYYLPDGKALEVLTSPPEAGLFPIVVMTSSGDEKIAVKAMKAGALDYIVKSTEVFKVMSHTLERALREWKLLKERKQAEEALRDSEEEFRSIAENLRDILFITDTKGIITYISPSVKHVFGYKDEDMEGHYFGEYLDEMERSRALPIFKNTIRTGIPTKNLSVFAKKRDGSTFYAEVDTSFIMKNGKVHGATGIIRDVSERKRAEKALQKSKEQLSSFMNSASDNLYLLDAKMNFVEINKKGLEHLGKRREDVIGKNIADIVPDVKTSGRYEKHLEVLKTGIPFVIEEFIPHPIFGNMHFILKSFKAGDCLGVIASDITEHKRAEQALRDSEQMLQIVLDSIPAAVFWKNRDLKYLGGNHTWLKAAGLKSSNEAVGKSDYDLPWEKEQADTFQEHDRKIIESGISEYDIIEPYLQADGTQAWAKTNKVPLRDADGNIIGVLGTYEDITERKQAEEALQESESQFRELWGATVEGITILDQGIIIEVNDAMCRTFGYTREQVIGKSLLEFAPTEMHDQIRERIVSGIEGRFEIPAVRADGTKIILETFAKQIIYKGKHVRMVATRDITERKQVDEILENERSLLRTLIDTLPDKIYIKDCEGRFIICNKATATRLGVSNPEEVVGKSDFDFLPHELAARFHADEQEIIRSGKSLLNHEEPLDQLSGTTRWNLVSKVPFRDTHGTIKGIVGSGRDITEQKEVERTLRENEQFFRLLFTTSPDSILIFNPFSTTVPWEILDCNEVACRMNGYTREELIGKSVDMLNTKVLTPEEREAHIMRLQQKGVAYFETLHRHRDGHIFPIDVASSIVTLGGRQLILGIDRDITERKQVEEVLRQMQKMEGLGTHAGGIAHDFNNILGIILAYNTSIKRFKGDTKKLDLAIETITKAVERGKTLVQQILTFARKTETEFGAVNVNDIVMEIMTMIFETFPKVLTYAQNIDKEIPCINADRSQLNQALLNLCINARDAMPSGGLLSISTHMVSSENLRHQHPDAAESSYVCIEVSDTGEGMTEEIRNRIFEPFFTTKGIGKGTGLGLAVVFGVVQTHKGFIDVDSELGKGTTFRMYLPATQVAEPTIEKKEERLEEIRGGTETLLVIEDEEMLLASLRMVLVEKGYKFISAGDGQTAIKIYQERKNDIALVLTDLGLPNISGLEVCRRIKKINPNERMILATGFLDPEIKSEFLKAGIQHFLYKPYDLTKVLKEVREVLDEK